MPYYKDSTSSSQSSSKRVLMACTECRKRKVRCNPDRSGVTRPCDRCSRNGLQCRYEPISSPAEDTDGEDGIKLFDPYAHNNPMLHNPQQIHNGGTPYPPNQFHRQPANVTTYQPYPGGYHNNSGAYNTHSQQQPQYHSSRSNTTTPVQPIRLRFVLPSS
ncbi:hypothetical protein PM082_011440 [Marasmius tenuissimus]|nr:hypothetical protein PM082_011440 [Marasmius tenuissimus]